MASSKQLIQAAAGAGSETEQYVAVACTGTVTDLKNSLVIWPFSKSEGFGTRQNLPTAPPNRPSSYSQVSWSPSGNAVAFTHFDNPGISVYAFSDGAVGSKYSNPPGLTSVSEGQGVAFARGGDAIAFTVNKNYYKVQGYTWTDASGFGSTGYTFYQNDGKRSVAWAPSDTHIVGSVQESSSNKFFQVQWSDPSWSSYSTASGSYSATYRMYFHPNGNWAIGSAYDASDNTKRAPIYSWSGSALTLETGFAMTGGTVVRSAAFSPDGNAIVLTSNGYPYIHAWPFNSSTGAVGTKFANPSTAGDYRGTEIKFNTDGDVVFMGTENSTLLNAWEFNSSTGFGSKYTNPDVSGLGTGPKCSGMDYIDFG